MVADFKLLISIEDSIAFDLGDNELFNATLVKSYKLVDSFHGTRCIA
jgi:hypothetical protein